MAIQFFFQDTQISLTERKRLKAFITSLFRSNGKSIESLGYVFCTDKWLLEMNRRFLKHDYYTDIITFDLSETPGQVRGEIYISVDRVRENAGNLGVSLKQELHRVIFHGALHLCGYKDKTGKDKDKMTYQEDLNIKKYLNVRST